MPPSPRRVLIVDDEPLVAAMLADVVSMLGYEGQVAANGSDALRLVSEFRPDVVLLDIDLPGMTGEVVLARVRDARPDLPVVILTGNTDADLARRTLELGAFDYVAKPFDLARLTQVLDAASALGE